MPRLPSEVMLTASLTLTIATGSAILLSGCSTATQPKPTSRDEVVAIQDASQAFMEMAERHASEILSISPEWGTQLGVDETIAGNRFQWRLSDYSAAGNRALADLNLRLLRELEGVDRSELRGTAAVTYDVMHNAYDVARRQNSFGSGQASILWAAQPYVVDQLFGPQVFIPRLFSAQIPITTGDQADAFLSRLSQVDRVMNEFIDMMERDAARGVVPPRHVLVASAETARAFIAKGVDENSVVTAFDEKLLRIADLSDRGRRDGREAVREIMNDQVYPAFAGFADRLEGLQTAVGDGDGIWKLSQGDDYYRVALDNYGATGMSADEIHAIGLADVARIHAEMDAILRGVGYANGPVGERMTALAEDPRYLWADTDEGKEEALEALRGYVDNMRSIVPDWFGDVPSQPLDVRRVPAIEEASTSGAYYTPPALDGSQPGIFWINLKSTGDWPKYAVKSLVYHEGIPGHHFQAASQQAIEDMPLIRNMMWFADYGEGWALYVEELAKEMGLYEGDALGDLGRLRMELYRAARLVVDTGLHDKRWTREQAIDWMTNATGETRESISREIDRYIVWPGQATSYKIGMIKFQRLREMAQSELDSAFDIRAFHDEILRGGAMPMPVLEARMAEWIDRQKGAAR